MAFMLQGMPFDPDKLAPWTSATTLSYHYGEHHRGYVTKLNVAIKGTPYERLTLEEIVVASRGKDPAIFNCAAQHWNHSFFWESLCASRRMLSAELGRRVIGQFGSVDAFKMSFREKALSLFGSGWTWLVSHADGTLEIIQTKDAENPLGSGKAALLVLDVWEHAYYLDHKHERARFIDGFWDHVNWRTVAVRGGFRP